MQIRKNGFEYSFDVHFVSSDCRVYALMRQCPVEQCTQQGKPKLTLFSNRVGLLKKLQSEFRRMGYLS